MSSTRKAIIILSIAFFVTSGLIWGAAASHGARIAELNTELSGAHVEVETDLAARDLAAEKNGHFVFEIENLTGQMNGEATMTPTPDAKFAKKSGK